jgi:hypothetical protein
LKHHAVLIPQSARTENQSDPIPGIVAAATRNAAAGPNRPAMAGINVRETAALNLPEIEDIDDKWGFYTWVFLGSSS